MVNKASQEQTGVYTKRVEDILLVILDWKSFVSHASDPDEETGFGGLSVTRPEAR